jgi:hypothetical protein
MPKNFFSTHSLPLAPNRCEWVEKIFISFYVGTYIKSTLALTVVRWLVPIIIIILLLLFAAVIFPPPPRGKTHAVGTVGTIPSMSRTTNAPEAEEFDRSLTRTARWISPRNDFPPTPFHPRLHSHSSSVIEFPHPGHYLLLGRVALGCRRDATFLSVLSGGPIKGHRAQLSVRSVGGRLLHGGTIKVAICDRAGKLYHNARSPTSTTPQSTMVRGGGGWNGWGMAWQLRFDGDFGQIFWHGGGG